MSQHDPCRPRFSLGARILFGLVLLVGAAVLAAAIYAFVERRGPPTNTPGGADYTGQQQTSGQPPSPAQ